MTKGCLLFAYNGTIDYGSQAVLAAKLAIKHLKVPVSLIADQSTIDNLHSSFKELPFDHIIKTEKPIGNNARMLAGETIEFTNGNRSAAYYLTPYDRTLLIDTDFLIFSDTLSNYWNDPHEFLITPGMLVLSSNIDPSKYHVSANTINLLWATNIMFSKSPTTQMLFDLVEYIKQEYCYFSKLYEFNGDQYRNDFAFSIACHIMSGHGCDPWHGTLPVPLFFLDNEEIIDVKETGQLNFLSHKSILSKCYKQDVHIMNKRSLLDNLEKLLRLADE